MRNSGNSKVFLVVGRRRRRSSNYQRRLTSWSVPGL
jgi:hypothetical protein